MGYLAPLRAEDPQAAFNTLFRESYAQAKAASQMRAGPVLIVAGDRLMLYRNGAQSAQAGVRPAQYHRLKAVAHVPLALQVLFTGPAVELDRIRTLRALAAQARAELGLWCGGALRDRQARILEACLQVLDDRLSPGGLAPGQLAAFTGRMGPLVLANAADAAGLELEELDRQVAVWRRAMAEAEWRALRVVISGSHMAREGEVTLQYFCRLLGEPGEGGRVVYAEGLWQPRDALDLLATHEVDGAAGAAFFGDPRRLHRDILADGAAAWLDGHMPINGH
jgi:hypothetical protein